MRSRFLLSTAAAMLALQLAGCDMLGIESTEAIATRKEAEGKAIGSACRHAIRAIEDCYTLNPKVSKAAIFAGWREMDEYMRENKLEGIPPEIARPSRASRSEAADKPADKPADPPADNAATH